MLPSLDAVCRAYAFMKLRHRWRRTLDLAGIEEALDEAATLAGGSPEREPAALLYAFLRRPMDLADGWPSLAYLIVELRLDPTDMELHALCMRLIARAPAERARYEDVLRFLEARIHPIR
jgi:hypothetical protein